ncbi:MAG: hypothetical protein U5Q44_01035 [Dehalococcoidia bacterium]|nr:hypothetical protein [Dehalococcoidia bacterium]
MGDKLAARRLVAEYGVPIVPGFDEPEQDDEQLAAAAGDVGFPLMVKAAAGGGGRGMRRVEGPDALASAIQGARREATRSFGDGRLFLERLVEDARHVEVQVFADQLRATRCTWENAIARCSGGTRRSSKRRRRR